jgi:hypothetical protein
MLKNRISKILGATLGAVVAVLIGVSVNADEGMWVYNNLPRKQLKEKYGFEPSDAWSEHLMKSSVRFNSGGSGSFISSTGLVLTNHHVGADTLYKMSTPEKDYHKLGYLAKTLADEPKAHDLELNQLVSIEDVTEVVNAAVKPEMSAAEASAARKAVIANIEKVSTEKTGLRSDVVTLYNGGQYHLYRYKKYTDVRLVFAPEFDIAFFGGDPDNFEFPRYDLDMCIFRVYEDGKPAKIDHFLQWNEAGPQENELVFVSGHPGKTSRMYTVKALEFLRDVRVPYTLNYLLQQEVLLQQYASKGVEQARRAKDELFGVQNSRKVYVGRIKGLQDSSLFLAKQKEEYALQAAVQSNPELKELAGAWDKIAKAQENHNKIYVRKVLLEGGQAFHSTLFSIARTLVRMAEEDTKPNEKRLAEFRDSGRASLLQTLYSDAPIYEDLETVTLSDSLSRLSTLLGKNHPLVVRVLEGQDPATRAANLIRNTTLKSTEVRKLIAKGGVKAIAESYDPMILLARTVDAASRAVRKQYEETVDELERQGYAQIAKAVFATKGTSTYPDATFTLRLSFGEVKGYNEGPKFIAPMTTLGGAFEHEVAHGATAPWKLPKSWHENKASLNLSTPFNFVSTADIIGGNSGSPVVNKNGELVGLIFDGNIHSLISDYFYSDVQNRSVSVHSGAMLETLRKVYKGEALAAEIGK